MRILFVSHLSHSASTGPNFSVPARIEAQSKIDEVYWLNLSNVEREDWKSKPYFHSANELRDISLDSIEKQFPYPDIVVMEGFYNMQQVFLSKELKKRLIPYVIVPRSSLTKQALNNHSWLKKYIAHKIFFDSYCHKALAIQYLTEAEFNDSGSRWNNNNIIIPNGINIPKEKKTNFSTDALHAVFVGRLDVYQKGLDILLNAINNIKNFLIQQNFHLTLYGPQLEDYMIVNSMIEELKIGDIVKMGGEILGEKKHYSLLNADLFILTSRFEGHPMGLIEALAYGLPVLITPGTNMAKEISQSNSGWICEANTESIKQSLVNIIESKMSFSQKGDNARLLSHKYDWKQLAQSFHLEMIKLIN